MLQEVGPRRIQQLGNLTPGGLPHIGENVPFDTSPPPPLPPHAVPEVAGGLKIHLSGETSGYSEEPN